nr:hypothetical protein [Rappaport israeli]
MTTPNHPWLIAAQNVLSIEAQAISAQSASLDQNFIRACQTILDCKGHLIVMGMGKSGILAPN